MRVKSLILFSAFLCSAPSAADTPPELTFPLACELGETCWVARYANREGKKQDYKCGIRTQVGHNGTDFMIPDLKAMARGVPVLAAAAGTVQNIRDGEPDVSVKVRGKDAIKGRECGNGLVINHDDGWTTQYCHMKNGSISVRKGQKVAAGAMLGEVGLSGETEYPHMHFSVRRGGKRIDPFDGQLLSEGCDKSERTALWQAPIPYSHAELVSATLTPLPPKRAQIWQASPTSTRADIPSLVLTGRMFGLEAGDIWHFKILKPDGGIFFEHKTTPQKNRQFHFQYAGKKRPAEGFSPGRWVGEITVSRQLETGETLHLHQTASILIAEN